MGNHTPPVNRAYLNAVREGRVHIGDTRCQVPDIAKLIPVDIEITEQGYRIASNGDPSNFIDVGFDVTMHGQAILSLTKPLAPAERNRFQQALQLNNRLSFGRVAMIESDEAASFVLVERRLYKFVSTAELSKMLRAVFAESKLIVDQKLLY